MADESRFVDKGIQAGATKQADMASKYATRELNPQSVMAFRPYRSSALQSIFGTKQTSKMASAAKQTTMAAKRTMTPKILVTAKQTTIAIKGTADKFPAESKQLGNQSKFNAGGYQIIQQENIKNASPTKQGTIAQKKAAVISSVEKKEMTEKGMKTIGKAKTITSTMKTITTEKSTSVTKRKKPLEKFSKSISKIAKTKAAPTEVAQSKVVEIKVTEANTTETKVTKSSERTKNDDKKEIPMEHKNRKSKPCCCS